MVREIICIYIYILLNFILNYIDLSGQGKDENSESKTPITSPRPTRKEGNISIWQRLSSKGGEYYITIIIIINLYKCYI